ncbi:ABC transporter permease [Kerstersia sp.]|uniref:ABC transporter permease n=1 Tax=Kerstersia sp. TaxID=1930783 RepID=UPI003F8F6F49
MNAIAMQGAWRRVAALDLLPVAMVLVAVALALAEPRFLSGQNLLNLLRGAALLMIVSIGQMLVLVSRGFDLSVGAVMALVSVVSASVMVHASAALGPQAGVLLGVLAGLGAGALVGLVNGLCVAWLGIAPFMVTLATASMAGGLALLLTNGIPVYGLPEGFVEWGRSLWLGVPAAVYLAALAIGLVAWVQGRTVLGVHLYAVGGNTQAARVSGLPVRRCQVLVYVACALLAAVASLLLTAQLGSGQGSLEDTIALQSIGAAVIAGVSLQGGVGKAARVALGALFLLLLNNAMDLLRIHSKAQAIVMGIFIVLVVALEEFRKHRAQGGRS